MNVKILILKSLEDVIAEVYEIVSGEDVIEYKLQNPYVVSLEEDRVRFYPYAPLSKDVSIRIPCDWVVSVVEPLDEVKQSYVEKLNGKPESVGN